MADLKPMYKGIAGDRTTELMQSFNASSDTSMTVFDTTIFPTAPNYVTVRMPNKSCLATFKYTGISGNKLTGLTFVESDIPLGQTATYPVGSYVYWSFVARLLNDMIDNITDGGGGGGTASFASLTGQPRDNALLTAELDAKLDNSEYESIDIGKPIVVQSDGTLKPQTITPVGTVNFADIGGYPRDNERLKNELDNLTVPASHITGTVSTSNLPVASTTSGGIVTVGRGLEVDEYGKLNNKLAATVVGTALVFKTGEATVSGSRLIIN